ncbi:MAG: NAD-dependent epimerase/dehydratase family protein [Pseudomonadota bacterium]
MTAKSKHIVIGGNSQIAKALRAHGFAHCDYVVRALVDGQKAIEVSDYAAITPDLLRGYENVINCVGVTSGPADLMQRINIELPEKLARAAREVGAARFIHISSFSIYGRAQVINAATKEAPLNDYGRSKLSGDKAIEAFAAPSFTPIALRLPLIYAPGALGKLGQLLSAWQKLRVFPVPSSDIARSMIGTELIAEVIAKLTQSDASGIVHAADPVPFSYELARAARPERLRTLPVPRIAVDATSAIAPDLGARLFANSLLDQHDNLAAQFGLSTRLVDDIRRAEF